MRKSTMEKTPYSVRLRNHIACRECRNQGTLPLTLEPSWRPLSSWAPLIPGDLVHWNFDRGRISLLDEGGWWNSAAKILGSWLV